MRAVIVRDNMRIPIGRQGENDAVRVVWPGIIESYAKLYGVGDFSLVVRRPGDSAPYPAVVAKESADLVWTVGSADTAKDGYGNVELTYTVGGAVAKSQTWGTIINTSLSGQEPTDPPEPQKSWVDEVLAAGAAAENAAEKAEQSVTHPPMLSSSDTWLVWDFEKNEYMDTELYAGGQAPEISAETHCWVINGQDTGVRAEAVSPTVDIETIDGGHRMTVTDINGKQSFDVKDGKPDPSLGVTGAVVGNIIKVSAVDDNGKPTLWEPADADNNKWELIASGELAEDASLSISKDSDGNAFSLKSVHLLIDGGATRAANPGTNDYICFRISRFDGPQDYDRYEADISVASTPITMRADIVCEHGKVPRLCIETPKPTSNWQTNAIKEYFCIHRNYSTGRDFAAVQHPLNNVYVGNNMGNAILTAGTKYELWGVRA